MTNRREEIEKRLKSEFKDFLVESVRRIKDTKIYIAQLDENSIFDLTNFIEAELKKARREVAEEIRSDIWRENRNVHNRSGDILKAVFVKLEEIIDQNKPERLAWLNQ